MIFGKVLLSHKSSDILHDSLTGHGRLWRSVAAVCGVSVDCCSKMV